MGNTVQPFKSKADRAKMRKALQGRDQLLFTLGIHLGLRISDLLTLRVGDLRGQRELTINESKTGKPRRIKLSAQVHKEMKSVTAPDDDFIFRRKRGDKNEAITRVQAYKILNAAAERAGIAANIGPIGCHSLRKTHGWLLHEKDVHITRIAKMLNHSSIEVTEKYIGITDDEIDGYYELIEI
ncbi:tyrosine-type recombinase/integrase [Geomicrobium sp. JSM 1781026]|uniref:tyrosine-type recombinase/integrase n=1 Tax=Geomicrobium sp. JSM 1781026 TaxID=3344580 RepID=UPI0035BF214C